MPLSLVSGAAGLVRMDWKKYSIATLIGMVPRILVLSFLGWKIGELYMNTAMQFESLETVVSVTIVLLVLFGIVAHKFRLIDRLKGLVA